MTAKEMANIVINDGGETFDPVTELRSKSHYGRPNFVYVFQQMKTAIMEGAYLPNLNQDKVNVGVFYCGPNAFAKILRDATNKVTTSAVEFNFSKEHF